MTKLEKDLKLHLHEMLSKEDRDFQDYVYREIN